MIVNGVQAPDESGFGRLFPYKDTGPHYVGPINLGGQIFTCKVWENVADNGRKYLRLIFEEPVNIEE